jgi:hypothetical protein
MQLDAVSRQGLRGTYSESDRRVWHDRHNRSLRPKICHAEVIRGGPVRHQILYEPGLAESFAQKRILKKRRPKASICAVYANCRKLGDGFHHPERTSFKRAISFPRSSTAAIASAVVPCSPAGKTSVLINPPC